MKRSFMLVSSAPHAEGKRLYQKGEIVRTERDLIRMFPNKFKEIVEAPVAPGGPETAADAPQTVAVVTANPGNPPPAGNPHGVDKTAEFEGAEKAGVLVLKQGAKFFNIVKKDNPTVLINADKLSKKDAEGFIAELLEDMK